jgi:flagellar hook-associated protein 3 FlgL
MFYRVTQSQMSITARNYLAKQTSELFTAQQQISSGLRIQKPADDPAGMRRSLIQKDRIERLEAHEVSVAHTKSRLSQADVQLRNANDLLTKAREIALQAPQITDDSERRVLAQELDGLMSQMRSIANSSDATGYLFSGTAANTMPFAETTAAGGQSRYDGTTQNTAIYIAGDVDRQTLLSGDQIFKPVSRENAVLIGTSGAAIGTGTNSAVGTKTLTVTHTLTTFSGGSGIQTGTSSAASDTVLGQSGTHSLVINDISGTGASGTISLNGGPAVSYTNGLSDLAVTGLDGEVVYVDTTAITPGFSGSVDLTATGSLSIDGGLTLTPITYDANQQIIDSRDGAVVNIDTTGMSKAGSDQLEFPGTSDIFNVLRELRDDLLNTRGLSLPDQNEALNRRLSDVERVQDHLLNIVGVQSVTLEQIDRLASRTEDLKLAEKVNYSDNVSADVAQAALRLQELNNLQQFTMAAVGQLLTPNLLNYIN